MLFDRGKMVHGPNMVRVDSVPHVDLTNTRPTTCSRHATAAPKITNPPHTEIGYVDVALLAQQTSLRVITKTTPAH